MNPRCSGASPKAFLVSLLLLGAGLFVLSDPVQGQERLLAMCACAAGLLLLLYILLSWYALADLRSKGEKIVAEIVEINPYGASISHEGLTALSPFGDDVQERPLDRYVVRAKWRNPESGVVFHFTSHPIPDKLCIPGVVDVIIDPRNPRRYWVDIVSARTDLSRQSLRSRRRGGEDKLTK